MGHASIVTSAHAQNVAAGGGYTGAWFEPSSQSTGSIYVGVNAGANMTSPSIVTVHFLIVGFKNDSGA